jgi:hypothetical protein
MTVNRNMYCIYTNMRKTYVTTSVGDWVGHSLSRIQRTILSSGAAGIVVIVIYRRITTWYRVWILRQTEEILHDLKRLMIFVKIWHYTYVIFPRMLLEYVSTMGIWCFILTGIWINKYICIYWWKTMADWIKSWSDWLYYVIQVFWKFSILNTPVDHYNNNTRGTTT